MKKITIVLSVVILLASLYAFIGWCPNNSKTNKYFTKMAGPYDFEGTELRLSDVRSKITLYEDFVFILQDKYCNTDERYAKVFGRSFWEESELLYDECYYISKEQYFSKIDSEDKTIRDVTLVEGLEIGDCISESYYGSYRTFLCNCIRASDDYDDVIGLIFVEQT